MELDTLAPLSAGPAFPQPVHQAAWETWSEDELCARAGLTRIPYRVPVVADTHGGHGLAPAGRAGDDAEVIQAERARKRDEGRARRDAMLA